MLKHLPRILAPIAIATLLFVSSSTVWAQGPKGKGTVDFLNSENLTKFNGLRNEVRTVLEGEFLPDLLAKGFSDAETTAFFTAVVNAEAEVETTLGNASLQSNPSFFKCSKKPTVIVSVGSRVGVYVSASCEQTVNAFTAGAEIWSGPTGHITDSHTRHNVTFTYVWAYADYHEGYDYRYCGTFTASVNDTPTPQPSYAKKCGRYRT